MCERTKTVFQTVFLFLSPAFAFHIFSPSNKTMIESLKSLLAEASVDHLPPDDPVASTGGQCEQCMDLPIRLSIKGQTLTTECCIHHTGVICCTRYWYVIKIDLT